MSRIVKIAGAVGLSLAVLGVALFAVSPALAQEPAPTPGPGGRGYGPGMMGGGPGYMAQYRDQMHAAVAEALGMTVEELNAEMAAGKMMWQIAEERGVSVEDVIAAKQAARAEVLAQLVEDGVISQEQADWMLSRMQARTQGQGGYGPGMMGGFQRGGRGFGPGMMGGQGVCPYAPTPSS